MENQDLSLRPLDAVLADLRWELVTEDKRSDEGTPQLQFFWLQAVYVIGSFVLAAYEISQRGRGGDTAQAVTAIQEGMRDLNRSIVEVSNRVDELAATLEKLLPEISKVVDKAAYRQILITQYGLADTARQSLATWLNTAELAVQMRLQILDALTDLQKAVNIILRAKEFGAVDGHLVVAPWVSLWRQSNDVANRIWAERIKDYIPTYSQQHTFFFEYAATLRGMLTQGVATAKTTKDWLAATTIPWGSSNPVPRVAYLYDFGPKTFAGDCDALSTSA